MSHRTLIPPAYLGFADEDFLCMLKRKKYRIDREVTNKIRDKAGSNWRLQRTVESVSSEIRKDEDFGSPRKSTDDVDQEYREKACTRIAQAIADYYGE